MPPPSPATTRAAAHDHLKILAAVDYDAMPNFGTRYAVKLSKASGDWVRFDEETSLHYALSCWVTKNLTGPQIESLVQTQEDHVSISATNRRLSVITSKMHAEAVASLSLLSGSKAGIDLNVGAGVSTGVGFKDDSVSVKVLGCGVVVGRKIGISLFDNSIGEPRPLAYNDSPPSNYSHAPTCPTDCAELDLGKMVESARSSTSTRTERDGLESPKRDGCLSFHQAKPGLKPLARPNGAFALDLKTRDTARAYELMCTSGKELFTPRGTATGAYEEFAMPAVTAPSKDDVGADDAEDVVGLELPTSDMRRVV